MLWWRKKEKEEEEEEEEEEEMEAVEVFALGKNPSSIISES